ncbi:phenylacetate--CoA ligase family protein [Sinanaerobacter chloroacetimidivorans]|uniref:Phenylacetate-coenzyme A ligase n=1 Tax=Sinanaerobacter chloroacetimidivorans TaxID=2818044 RepID=A0A8J7W6R5_9FIRM|nr:phenylacetate--CoA ligase [Sinanaerobacter chloroacetimidivorans]MBR0600358.1 phenylacetate--CoA ligase [Sinanaerobacter chloroacetimidivorans]
MTDSKIWSREETFQREEFRSLQLERLQATVNRVYDKVPYYKNKLQEAGVEPGDIKTLEDIQKLPFTVKADFRDTYPFGLFASTRKEIVRFHASSGTTGKPTVVGYTRKDMDTWCELIARLVTMAGVTDEDTAQISFGYGLFTGAFGLHQGLERVGASVIPMSSGNTQKQIMVMQDFGTTTLISTPSYALHMAEVAWEMGIDPKKDLHLKWGLFGGEGSTEAMRRELNENWGLFATENYGMSELIGPGVSGECQALKGMHISEDHFLPEIIDPATGKVLGEGEVGELVITTITKEALPILRYRTKDITSLHYETCDCGRTTVRMSKIQGRSDDMLILGGVNVFPSQIEEVLLNIEGIGPHYQIKVFKKGYLDKIEVDVELIDANLLESFTLLESLNNKIKNQLRTVLGIDAKVNLVEPRALARFEGKAKRVIDMREEQ